MLRYPGGKHRVRKQIFALAPAEYDEVREPFTGGCNICLAAPKHKRIWLNDISPIVFKYFTWLRDCEDSIDRMMRIRGRMLMMPDLQKRAMFHAAKIALTLTHDPLAFFVLNRYACNAIVNPRRKDLASFGSVFMRNGMNQVSWHRLEELRDLLRRSTFTNVDYAKVLDFPGKNPFIVLDPPYTIITHSSPIYQYVFSRRDHEVLAERLRATKHKWLLTIHSHQRTFDLYRGFNFHHRAYTCAMPFKVRNNSRAREELWITNY